MDKFLVNKLKIDEVQLKDALVKLQTLNEALGEDKINLGKVVRQVEIERDEIYKEKENLESEKSHLKEVKLFLNSKKKSYCQSYCVDFLFLVYIVKIYSCFFKMIPFLLRLLLITFMYFDIIYYDLKIRNYYELIKRDYRLNQKEKA